MISDLKSYGYRRVKRILELICHIFQTKLLVYRCHIFHTNSEIPVDMNTVILFVIIVNAKLRLVKGDTLGNAVTLKDFQDVNSECFASTVMLLFLKTMRKKQKS